ncbi:hypothetical protein HPP92_024574 [Vanilla planifolia]|uniref:Pentatricopeptide repeat-containing protein n=1 Tax=Vanilla planifolia TaxID=51239 RepID=A0A835PMM5_VANPL|nr:hypothetical protein HPP92_024574 [Vanilla planifolia]
MESCLLVDPSKPLLLTRRDWNSTLKQHVKLKNDQAILKTYSEMVASGVHPSRDQLPLFLKTCTKLRNVELGRSIHANARKSGLVDDVKVMTALIDFYSKSGFLEAALVVFDEMAERDVVAWNALIGGFAENSMALAALRMFRRMWSEGSRPNAVTLVGLLSACREINELRLGREVHCYCLRKGFLDTEVRIGTSLIDFYSECDVFASRLVFDLMEIRNVVSWNVVLFACVDSGKPGEALSRFVDMLEDGTAPDSVTFLAILESCADLGCAESGKQVHHLAIKLGLVSDNFVANALIVMYGKCGDVESSLGIFEEMVSLDIASCNAMLASCRNCACSGKAFDLFKGMLEVNNMENSVTHATMVSICSLSNDVKKGKEMHAYVIKAGTDKDVNVKGALLCMYVQLHSINFACKLFDQIEKADVVSWNTLIKGMVCNGYTKQAWELFGKMQLHGYKPNSYTMVSLLAEYKDSSARVGKSIHGYVLRQELQLNPSLCTALSDMYMNSGYESSAMQLFWNYSERDIISWNALITCSLRTGQPCKALSFFYQMQSEVRPNSTTVVIALLSCAKMANLSMGRCLHAYICRREMDFGLDQSLGNALLTMYAKCGSLKDAKTIFRNLTNRDVISWNAMIAAYGIHGSGNDALDVFHQMLEAGEKPTNVTFASILSSCSHSGMLEKGQELFHCMQEDYGMIAEIGHYGCMVDLLGRSGLLDAAVDLVNSMPVEPDASVWRALLSACRLYGNVDLARLAAQKLFELEPLNTGNYVLLSNIYAAAGRWEDVKALKKKLKKIGSQKVPGSSWIDIRNQTHAFTPGSKLYPPDLVYQNQESILDDLIKNWTIF